MELHIDNTIEEDLSLNIEGTREELKGILCDLWQSNMIDEAQWGKLAAKLEPPVVKPADKLRDLDTIKHADIRAEAADLLDECQEFLEHRLLDVEALHKSVPPSHTRLLAKLRGEKTEPPYFGSYEGRFGKGDAKPTKSFASIRILGFGTSSDNAPYASVRVTNSSQVGRVENLYRDDILNFPMPDIT